MTHELWLVKGSTMTNITPLVGTIMWRSNIDELGDEITFDVAFNDTKFFPKNPCDIGDIIVLKNGSEITRGIIVEESRNGISPVQYTAYDYAFYLNKSSAVYQFNKMPADACIKKILDDFGVPIGKITAMPKVINKIYNNKVVSEIIKDILDIAGKKLFMEMDKGKLNIVKRGDIVIKANFSLYTGDKKKDATLAISNPSHKRSIADMINSIQVVGNNDKVVLEKSDSAMVSKYGKLQKVITLDQEEKKSAAVMAQEELDEFSKIVHDISLELIGDDHVRAGRVFEIEEPFTKISGKYLISDVTHTLSDGHHKMSMNLEVM